MYYLKHSVWRGPKSVVCCRPRAVVRKGTKAAVETEMYLSRWNQIWHDLANGSHGGFCVSEWMARTNLQQLQGLDMTTDETRQRARPQSSFGRNKLSLAANVGGWGNRLLSLISRAIESVTLIRGTSATSYREPWRGIRARRQPHVKISIVLFVHRAADIL